MWQQLSDTERNDYLSTAETGSFYMFNERMRTWTLTEKETDIGLEELTVLSPKYYNYPFDYEKCMDEAIYTGWHAIKYARIHTGYYYDDDIDVDMIDDQLVHVLH